MPVPSYAFLSATAGLAGSLASVSAKFVFGALPEFLNDAEQSSLPIPSSVLSGIFRVIFIITTILMNGVMWAFYMKALSVSGNSLQALAINTACNFVSSAAFGYLFFGDLITGSWFFGASLMLMGIVLMNTGDAVLTHGVTATSDDRDKKKL